MTFGKELRGGVAAAEGGNAGGADAGHSRHARQGGLDLVEESAAPLARHVVRGGDGHLQQAVHPEAGGHALELDEASPQEACADQKHHRQRHLGGDEQFLQLAPGTRNRSRAAPQRALQVRSHDVERRRQAEHDAGDQRDREGKKEDPAVDGHFLEPRHGDRRRAADRGDGGAGESRSGDGAEDREHHALGEELPHQAPPAGPERRPHRHLALPRDRLSELQVGDVRAGEKEQEPHRAEQHQELPPQIGADDGIRKALHPSAPLAVGPGIEARQPGGHAHRIGIGLRDRHTGLEAAVREEQVIAAVGGRVRRERHPEIAGKVAIAVGHHAGDPVRDAVQIDRRPDDARIGPEQAPPDSLAEHHHVLVAAGLVLLDVIGRPRDGAPAEEREPRRRRREAGERDRLSAAQQAGAAAADRGHGGEAAGAVAHVEIVGLGGGPGIAGGVGLVDAHHPIRIRHRDRPQGHRVDHAEHRGGGAGAERERDDGDQREGRRVAQAAQRIADVGEEVAHRASDNGEGAGISLTLFAGSDNAPAPIAAL